MPGLDPCLAGVGWLLLKELPLQTWLFCKDRRGTNKRAYYTEQHAKANNKTLDKPLENGCVFPYLGTTARK